MMLAWVLPRKPGAESSSVARQPPISCLRSKIPTLMPPYLMRYMARRRALLPPPTITASKVLSAITASSRSRGGGLPLHDDVIALPLDIDDFRDELGFP